MSISVEFQKRLIDLISEEEKNTKAQLAKKIGIDYRSFSSAINYGILPKPMGLVKIADYYKVSVAYLLGKTENYEFTPAKKPSSFHERLELLREEKKVTYYKIAKECFFDKSCISKWFSKNHIPSYEILELLIDYFDVSIDYLLGRTDDM